MAHTYYTPQVQRRLSGRLEDIMPANLGGCNFAAFGGTLEQRIRTAVQAASRYCGRCGIVVLSNASVTGEDPLESALSQLAGKRPGSSPVTVRTLPNRSYDPLYGLDEDSIVQLLLARSSDQSLTAGLLAYLKIIRHNFRLNPVPFGDYPFNLNLLRELTAMPYGVLKERVLNYLPPMLQEEIVPMLNKSDIPSSVFSVVERFGTTMKKYLWTQDSFDRHTRISITQAVCDRQIICLRIPNSNADLLSYVEYELSNLTTMGIPYLLIGSGLKLSVCSELQNRFLSEHRQENYYTGILSDSIFDTAETRELQNNLVSLYDQIMVYQCAGIAQAEPFSQNLGVYKHRLRLKNRTTHRKFLQLLPEFGNGFHETMTDERNVRPEELIHIPDGVLVCGRLCSVPQLIKKININGGANDGILLHGL